MKYRTVTLGARKEIFHGIYDFHDLTSLLLIKFDTDCKVDLKNFNTTSTEFTIWNSSFGRNDQVNI